MEKNDKNLKKDQPKKNPVPDGGYGWIVLLASFFISFIIDGIMYSMGLLIGPIKTHYNIDNKQANMLTSLNTGFLFCSGPIVAGLTNTFGCRKVIMGGAIVTSIIYFLCCFSSTVYPIMIMYGVFGGISTGCTYISSLIVIAEYFDKKIGTATGIVMAGSGVGSFCIPVIMTYFLNNYDWKFTFSMCASSILICFGLGSLLRPLNPIISSSKSKSMPLKNIKNQKTENDYIVHEEKIIQSYIGSVYSLNVEKKLPFYQRNAFLRLTMEILAEMTNFKLLRQNFGFLLITLSNFFLFTGYFLPYIYIVRIADEEGMSNPDFLLSIMGITNIPFRMLFGLIADKKIISALNLNTLCVVFATGPFFIYKLILMKHTWGQYVFALCFAIGTAGMNSLTTAYLVDLVGVEKFGNATGIINLFRGIGCSMGPVLGGILADKTSIEDTFYFSGICFVIGSVFTTLASFLEIIKKTCMKNTRTVEVNNNDNRVTNMNDTGVDKNLLQEKIQNTA